MVVRRMLWLVIIWRLLTNRRSVLKLSTYRVRLFNIRCWLMLNVVFNPRRLTLVMNLMLLLTCIMVILLVSRM